MTKQEIIEWILEDMEKKSDDKRETIERRWRGWMSKQKKQTLEEIMENRKTK